MLANIGIMSPHQYLMDDRAVFYPMISSSYLTNFKPPVNVVQLQDLGAAPDVSIPLPMDLMDLNAYYRYVPSATAEPRIIYENDGYVASY